MTINPPNLWRLETPGHEGWARTARPDDPNRYFMVSADTHANEPGMLWHERIDAKYRDRLPKIERDENGVLWQSSEGYRKTRLIESQFEGEDKERADSGRDPQDRLRDHDRDGIDVEVIFPTRASPCGRRPTRNSPTRCAASTTTGRGSSSAPTPTACCPWPASPPATCPAR
jgi:hypothetical protein